MLGFSLLNEIHIKNNDTKMYTAQVFIKHILSFRFDYFLASKEIREIYHFHFLSRSGRTRVFFDPISFLVKYHELESVIDLVSAFLCMANQLRVRLSPPSSQAHINALILFQRGKPL